MYSVELWRLYCGGVRDKIKWWVGAMLCDAKPKKIHYYENR